MAKTKSAPAKKLKDGEFALECYSVKKKEVVAIAEGTAKITKTSRGAYMLQGEDEDGGKVAGIIATAKAEYFIENEMAEDCTVEEEVVKPAKKSTKK